MEVGAEPWGVSTATRRGDGNQSANTHVTTEHGGRFCNIQCVVSDARSSLSIQLQRLSLYRYLADRRNKGGINLELV